MSPTDLWLTRAKLITPYGVVEGSVRIRGGRVAAIHGSAPRGARAVSLGGRYLAPGFIDLHLWGDPWVASRSCAMQGTTAFLTTVGPDAPQRLAAQVAERAAARRLPGAACLGIHAEGPFLNPARGGALPRRWMRRPSVSELGRLARRAGRQLKLMTIAPELPGALQAIRWCRRKGVVASLGHSDADASAARRAVDAGAGAVTHVFNGMRAFHHRAPGLLDVALADPRLATMVIADGVHVSPEAFRLLVRVKGVHRVALVTDSIRHQGWEVVLRGGAYYTKRGVLAGSRLTMIEAVRNAMRFGGVSLREAVGMATEVPAKLLGLRSRGALVVGKRADLVAFDRRFRVRLTMVGGRIVYRTGE